MSVRLPGKIVAPGGLAALKAHAEGMVSVWRACPGRRIWWKIAELANGLLWILEADPVWAGHGTLQPCVVRRLKIHNYEIQYDVVGPRGSLPVHVKCYRIWRGHSDKPTTDM
jgi:hypothetical protein